MSADLVDEKVRDRALVALDRVPRAVHERLRARELGLAARARRRNERGTSVVSRVVSLSAVSLV